MSTATITALRDWLLTCPAIIDAAEDQVTLRTNFLGPDPVQFSIEDSPADPVLRRYFNGTLRVKNFSLTSRMDFAEQDAIQCANSALLDQLCDWIDAQADLQHLPTLSDGKCTQWVAVTSTGYLQSVDGSTCKLHLQLQLQYFQPRGVLQS